MNNRIRATAAAGSRLFDWIDDIDIEANHAAAARAYAKALGWTGTLATGTLKDGSFVHVFTGRK